MEAQPTHAANPSKTERQKRVNVKQRELVVRYEKLVPLAVAMLTVGEKINAIFNKTAESITTKAIPRLSILTVWQHPRYVRLIWDALQLLTLTKLPNDEDETWQLTFEFLKTVAPKWHVFQSTLQEHEIRQLTHELAGPCFEIHNARSKAAQEQGFALKNFLEEHAAILRRKLKQYGPSEFKSANDMFAWAQKQHNGLLRLLQQASDRQKRAAVEGKTRPESEQSAAPNSNVVAPRPALGSSVQLQQAQRTLMHTEVVDRKGKLIKDSEAMPGGLAMMNSPLDDANVTPTFEMFSNTTDFEHGGDDNEGCVMHPDRLRALDAPFEENDEPAEVVVGPKQTAANLIPLGKKRLPGGVKYESADPPAPNETMGSGPLLGPCIGPAETNNLLAASLTNPLGLPAGSVAVSSTGTTAGVFSGVLDALRKSVFRWDGAFFTNREPDQLEETPSLPISAPCYPSWNCDSFQGYRNAVDDDSDMEMS